MSKNAKAVNTNMVYAMAFVAVICSALAWLIAAILGLVQANSNIPAILKTVAAIILFTWALFTSYNYVRNKASWVKVIYWISVVIVVTGVVLDII
ncbi:MAG: hypothetical protein EOM87_06430 [Clostridia bacterium]|nr:hypothetical protein [Clostridia bacterium]